MSLMKLMEKKKWGNRAYRRKMSAWLKRGGGKRRLAKARLNLDPNHWFIRIAGSMRQSETIIMNCPARLLNRRRSPA